MEYTATNATDFDQPDVFQAFHSATGYRQLILWLVLPLVVIASTNHAIGSDSIPRGVLDQPLFEGAGDDNIIQPSGAELATLLQEQEQALDREENRLRNLSRPQLQQLAENGERAAQLILAKDFADEANNRSFTVDSANDALSGAAYWFSLAARRGFPGAPAVDKAFPIVPLRVVRDTQ